MPRALKEQAAGVHATLERRFSAAEVDLLDELFVAALRSSVNSDAALVRPAGADYNPRPGRILHILLTQLELPSMEYLCAALLACLPPAELTPFFAHADPHVRSAADLAQQALSKSSPFSHPAAETAALALELDNARHLHMRPLNTAEFNAAAKSSLEVLERGAASALNLRLRTLVQATVERQRRHHE